MHYCSCQTNQLDTVPSPRQYSRYSKTAAMRECCNAYVMYSITDSYGFSVFTVFKCSAPFDNKLSNISNIKENSRKDFYKALLIEYTIPIYIKSTIPETMIYGAARKGANVATRFMTRCTIAAITERTIIPTPLPPAPCRIPKPTASETYLFQFQI